MPAFAFFTHYSNFATTQHSGFRNLSNISTAIATANSPSTSVSAHLFADKQLGMQEAFGATGI